MHVSFKFARQRIVYIYALFFQVRLPKESVAYLLFMQDGCRLEDMQEVSKLS